MSTLEVNMSNKENFDMTLFIDRMTTLGEYITRIRESQNLSLRELADKAGINHEALRKIEMGTTDNPGIRSIIGIARVLKLEPADLISAYQGKDPEKVKLKDNEQYRRACVAILREIPKDLRTEYFNLMSPEEVLSTLPESVIKIWYTEFERRKENQ